MPISINGTGSITGISAGGLPDDCITTAEIAAGAVTQAKLGSGEASGLAKAWVNFNGTGTVAIRASYNVSSITDNGVGDYTINFVTAMVDANYSVQIPGSVVNTWARAGVNEQARLTAASVRVTTAADNGVAADRDCVNVAIFR